MKNIFIESLEKAKKTNTPESLKRLRKAEKEFINFIEKK